MKIKFFSHKFLTHILTSAISGTIFGIIGLLFMTNIGGNYGCHPFIDFLFKSRGYESCGLLGLYGGILIGVILLLFLLSRGKYKDRTYIKINKIIGLIFAFILFNLFLGGAFIGYEVFSLPMIVGLFFLYSLILAIIFSVILNIKN